MHLLFWWCWCTQHLHPPLPSQPIHQIASAPLVSPPPMLAYVFLCAWIFLYVFLSLFSQALLTHSLLLSNRLHKCFVSCALATLNSARPFFLLYFSALDFHFAKAVARVVIKIKMHPFAINNYHSISFTCNSTSRARFGATLSLILFKEHMLCT